LSATTIGAVVNGDFALNVPFTFSVFGSSATTAFVSLLPDVSPPPVAA
jgi:hypothetical protein